MQDLVIQGNSSTPYIRGSWADGRLEMTGDSYPENAFELYQPVIDWVGAYLRQSDRPLLLALKLLYLNTSSIRAMIDMLDLLQNASDGGRQVRIVWSYERGNERAGELAEEFREDYTFPFEIVPQD